MTASVRLHYGGDSHELRLPFLIESYLYDLLAALGAARALNLPWSRWKSPWRPLPAAKRGTIFRSAEGITVIDGLYNSSPQPWSGSSGYVELPAKTARGRARRNARARSRIFEISRNGAAWPPDADGTWSRPWDF